MPSLGLTDTARFTIVPASASEIFLNPLARTVGVGASFTMEWQVSDQYLNTRTDPVTWSSSAPGLTVSPLGVVNASAVGRYAVRATTTAGTAAADVSVVPAGHFAATRIEIGNNVRVYAMDLDGSNQRTVLQASALDIPSRPVFIPGTNRLLYISSANGRNTFRTIDANGTSAPFFVALPQSITSLIDPTPSADGRWLFFAAVDARCGGTEFQCLFRSRTDGTAVEIIGDALPPGIVNWRPAPSPDGSKVAYVTSAPGGATIKVFDLATRTTSAWGVPGQHPSWSPVGNTIAYTTRTGGPLMVVNADGSGSRQLTPPGYSYAEGPISWSADGRWILAAGSYLELIDAQTGLGLRLHTTINMRSPSLR